MLNIIKNNKIFALSVFIASLFWLIESILHAFFFEQEMGFEIMPHEANELWMRVIIVLLISLIGFLAGQQVKLEKKIQEEKIRTLKASIVSINDVVGNTLSLMSHYCDDFLKSGEADMKAVETMKNIIEETFVGLSNISELNIMFEEEKRQDEVRKH